MLALLLVTAACGDDDDGDEASAADDTSEEVTDDEEASDGEEAGDDETGDEEAPGDEEFPVDDNETFVRFTALGLDSNTGVLEFGAPADDVLERLHGTWGDPVSDTGDSPSGTDCVTSAETYRRVEWEGLLLEFLDGQFRYWLSSSPDQSVIAFVGDETSVPIQPGHTTVAELSDVLGEAFEASDEPPLGPSFTITDNWGDLGGELSDVTDEGVVQSVRSGIGCGE